MISLKNFYEKLITILIYQILYLHLILNLNIDLYNISIITTIYILAKSNFSFFLIYKLLIRFFILKFYFYNLFFT